MCFLLEPLLRHRFPIGFGPQLCLGLDGAISKIGAPGGHPSGGLFACRLIDELDLRGGNLSVSNITELLTLRPEEDRPSLLDAD